MFMIAPTSRQSNGAALLMMILFFFMGIVACSESKSSTMADSEETDTWVESDQETADADIDPDFMEEILEEIDQPYEWEEELDLDEEPVEESEPERIELEREWSEYWTDYRLQVERTCTSDRFCRFKNDFIAPRRLGPISEIRRNGENAVWVIELGSNSSVLHYNGNRWNLVELPESLEAELFDFRTRDSDLELFAATRSGGLGMYSEGAWQQLSFPLTFGSFGWDRTEACLGILSGMETNGNWSPFALNWGEEPVEIETNQSLKPDSLYARDYEILALNHEGTLMKDFIPDIACLQNVEKLRIDPEGRILAYAHNAEDNRLLDPIIWFREGESEGCVEFARLPDEKAWFDFYEADDGSLWFSGDTGRVMRIGEDIQEFWRVYDPADDAIPSLTAIGGFGETVLVGTSNGRIFEYNGENWGGRSGLVNTSFSSVVAVNEYDVYIAGGMFAQIRHGHVYILVSDWDIQSLWAVTGHDVWAGCGEGKMYHWDGSVATVHGLDGWPELPIKASAIHGCGTDHAWAVGKGGSITHWNGSSWSSVASPTENDLIDVVSLAPNLAFAIHAGGGLRWNGEQWTAFTFPFSDAPLKFHLSNEGDLYVLTTRSVWKFTSQRLWELSVQFNENMKQIADLWSENGQGLWLVSRSGSVWSDRSGAWQEYEALEQESDATLYAIAGVTNGKLYLVGTEGTIVMHDPSETTSR